MIRNIRGMILELRGMSDRVQAGRLHNSLDGRGGLRSRVRARYVPDRKDAPGFRRSVTANRTGLLSSQLLVSASEDIAF